ncbi:NAD dehydrogenase [Lasiosphaeria hispida]|uniref:NAD dehydrogenase n=1 Tax=Lasiosphaeria hispida TaxID=260671 RepID=A0AAJ0HWQ7_9PEZI|nr:NAD dehydrogenase [Lasiosphaeria hispida]
MQAKDGNYLILLLGLRYGVADCLEFIGSQVVQLYYAKGNYFSYNARAPGVSPFIYPAPEPGHGGLGTHLTLDLAGRMRFGPDVEWCEEPDDLDVNPAKLPDAIREIRKNSAMVQGQGFPDFVVHREEGIPAWVNLLGIESPGLTSSLAIAEMVESLLYK